MDIIQEIKKEAINQKISLSEIGRRLEMSQQSFNQMLKPESIKFSVVKKIADILEVGIDDLINGNNNKVNKNIEMSNHTTIENRLLSIIESQQKTIEMLTYRTQKNIVETA